MNVKLIGINGRYSHSTLALFYVRQQLVAHCSWLKGIEIVQFTINDPYYKMFLRIGSQEPDCLFFSAYVWNSDRICRLIRDLKRAYPSCCVVVGGPQAEVVGKRFHGGECTIIMGEVERLADSFYSDLVAGELQPFYRASLPAKGELFPFPYKDEDFHTHLQDRHIYYESSRGCPFSCTYCLSSIDKVVYHKSLDMVTQELEQILAHRPKVVRFVDRTFNDRPERALAIWKFLADRGSNTTFHFEISPRGFSEQMYNFLASVPVGLFQFEIGIQSTHQKTLQVIRRMIDSGKACEVIGRLAGLGNIHLHVDLILGLPYDTKRSFFDSFVQVFDTGAHYIQMGLLKILPDTPLYHSCSQYEYTYCHQPPYEIISTYWLDPQQLRQLYWFGECVEKFMNNRYFPSIWKYLRQVKEDVELFFENLLKLCHSRLFFQLAPTQELMCRLLLELSTRRDDQHLFRELLRYDWLRCGHRFLPDCLQVTSEEKGGADLKRQLFKQFPEQLQGVYSKKSRNHFFKTSFFCSFTGNTLQALGYYDKKQPAVLCFLSEREESVFQLSRVVLMEAKYIF